MRQTIVIAALVMFSATTTRVQEHAPIAAQCQADKAVWLQQLNHEETTKLLIHQGGRDIPAKRIIEPSAASLNLKPLPRHSVSLADNHSHFRRRQTIAGPTDAVD